MARWKLMTGHYLMVAGTQWEYTETNREGKQVRKRYDVPMLLNPEDPDQCNSLNEFGEPILVVTDGKGGHPSDVTFIGDPSPDMFPLDEAAEAISAKFREKWEKAGVAVGGSEGLLSQFQTELSQALATGLTAAQPVTGMNELLASMAEMMKQNQQMLMLLAQQQANPMVVLQPTPTADAASAQRQPATRRV